MPNNDLELVAIVGSLRRDSFSRAVFEAAKHLVEPGVRLTDLDIGQVPLYNGDLEAEGDPASITALKEAVAAADGLIIFTPEYNRSIPAVTKNVVDWLSRIPGQSVLSTAAVGIVAATPGRHEAAGVRAHLATSIAANTKRLFETSLGISSISQKLTDNALTDNQTRRDLAVWLAHFATHIRASDHERRQQGQRTQEAQMSFSHGCFPSWLVIPAPRRRSVSADNRTPTRRRRPTAQRRTSRQARSSCAAVPTTFVATGSPNTSRAATRPAIFSALSASSNPTSELWATTRSRR